MASLRMVLHKVAAPTILTLSFIGTLIGQIESGNDIMDEKIRLSKE